MPTPDALDIVLRRLGESERENLALRADLDLLDNRLWLSRQVSRAYRRENDELKTELEIARAGHQGAAKLSRERRREIDRLRAALGALRRKLFSAIRTADRLHNAR